MLGTGHGDVLAVDVAAGQLKWKFADCHPGGVSAVSFSRHNSCIYTGGVDCMVCQIDPANGNLLSKYKASTKAISSLSISPDGKILAAASAQLKLFSCLDNKKIQRFPGHPVSVRCMIFSEDGKYILSSAVGEKYIAIWRTDAGKKQPACCVLSMEHPAVFLDCKCSNVEGTVGTGFYVLAVSETGLCYFWYGSSIEELRVNKPTRISLSVESSASKKKGAVFAAKFQGIVRPESAMVLVAYGSLVKPSFEKLTVQYGVDVNLETSQEGVLLPRGQSHTFKKGQMPQSKVTALDRANAEDAMLPLPKIYSHEKKRKHTASYLAANIENGMDVPVNSDTKRFPAQKEDILQTVEEDVTCLEDRLREIGILVTKKKSSVGNYMSPKSALSITLSNGTNLSFDADLPRKKIRSHILSMLPGDAYKFLEILVGTWKKRSTDPKHVLTWIYYVLVCHGDFITSLDSSGPTLDALHKITSLKCSTVQPLLKLWGRLGLITAQIDKAGQSIVAAPLENGYADASEEDEEEEIDELVYGKEEEEFESD